MNVIRKILKFLPVQYALIVSGILLLGLMLDETGLLDGDAGVFVYVPATLYLLWRIATHHYKESSLFDDSKPRTSAQVSLVASLILLLNPQFWISSGHPPLPGVYLLPVFFLAFFLIDYLVRKRLVQKA